MDRDHRRLETLAKTVLGMRHLTDRECLDWWTRNMGDIPSGATVRRLVDAIQIAKQLAVAIQEEYADIPKDLAEAVAVGALRAVRRAR